MQSKGEDVEFYRNKLVIDIVKDICGNLEKPLREKVRKLLSDIDLSFYMNLHKDETGGDHKSNNILGLTPPVLEELTFSEQKLLQAQVEKYILVKYPKQFALFEELLAPPHSAPPTQERERLLGLSERYVELLGEGAGLMGGVCQLMGEWCEVRRGAGVERHATEAELLHVKNKILELKAKIIEVQVSLSVYSPHGGALAYMAINKDITSRMDFLRAELLNYQKILHNDS